MSNDYANIFKNQRASRRREFGNVYNPYVKVNAWKLIRTAVLTILVVSVIIGTAFVYMTPANAHTTDTPLRLKLSTSLS